MGSRVSTAAQEVKGKDLTGQHIIVTGSSGGIGEETVKVLYYSGATVIMASRNRAKMEEATKRILSAKNDSSSSNNKDDGESDEGNEGKSGKKCCHRHSEESDLNDLKGEIHIMELDLGDLSSVSSFVREYESRFNRLHILINNAGQMATPLVRTKDGFESQIGINHLGHFALTLPLLPLMKRTCEQDNVQCRIVNVSSEGHKAGVIDLDDLNFENRSYSPFSAYGQSKLANILFTKELNRRLTEDGVNIRVNCLHPGVIKTDLGRDSTISRIGYTLASPFLKSIAQGAATTVFCAVSDQLKDQGGLYFADCAPLEPNSYGQDMTMAGKLFELSEKLTHVQYPFGSNPSQSQNQSDISNDE